jgi:hypothetical protein
MTFKSAKWYPIAVALSVLNLVGAGFAFGQAEPLHAMAHVALGLAFGLWAQRLRRIPDGTDLQYRLEALEAEVGQLDDVRRELAEVQERLDFAERLMAQGQDAHRVGPER